MRGQGRVYGFRKIFKRERLYEWPVVDEYRGSSRNAAGGAFLVLLVDGPGQRWVIERRGRSGWINAVAFGKFTDSVFKFVRLDLVLFSEAIPAEGNSDLRLQFIEVACSDSRGSSPRVLR